jgi:hypothetical protein
MISEDPVDIAAIGEAIEKPELVVISDWSQFKSWEYLEAEDVANINLLYEPCVLFLLHTIADKSQLCG